MRFIAILLCLIAVPAFGEFTPAEKAEIAKVINAQGLIGNTLKPLGDSLQDFTTDTSRPVYYNALVASVDAAWECHESMRHLLNSQFVGFGGATRSAIVTAGISHAFACHARMQDYAAALDAVIAAGSNPNIATYAASLRASDLNTFNASLAYTDYQPFDYPRIIGPHGDFDAAQLNLEIASAGIVGYLAAITAFYGQVDVLPSSAHVDIREVIRYVKDPLRFISRMWGLDSGVVASSQDQTRIDGDVAAGSGLRDFDFFKELRVIELGMSSDKRMPFVFSGRKVDGGIAKNFSLALSEFPKAVGKAAEVNTSAETASWFTGTPGTDPPDLARRTDRFAAELMHRIGEAWSGMDGWAASAFLFFHTIPPIPGGGGLVCGPGTHEEDGLCVPDATPPTCPTFVAELVLLDGITGQARCVEVP